MSAAPADLLVTTVLEAEMHKVLDQRAALKRVPGTHAEQDRLLAEASRMFDQLVELRARPS